MTRVTSEAEPNSHLTFSIRAAIAVLGTVTALFVLRGYFRPQQVPLFQLVATSLVHGHLDIGKAVRDSAPFHGHFYVPLGPFPALLMVPLVLIGAPFALELWLGLAATTASLFAFWGLFKELAIDSKALRVWLMLGTVAGTSFLSAVVINSSYYLAHLVVVALVGHALLQSLRGRNPFLAGLLVGFATMTRASVVVAIIPIALLQVRARPASWRKVVALLALGLAPSLAILALYNQLRFNSPLESGYALQSLDFRPLELAREQGLFSPIHVPKNLYYLLVAVPDTIGRGAPYPIVPGLQPSDWGTGLLWVSPWLLVACFARGRVAALLAAATTIIILPSLFYYGVGWIQFGYRYALDALPFVACLAALGAKARAPGLLLKVAIIYSVVVNVLGANWLLTRLGA